jgi:DNA-binding GntR family transcriptional regulator
MGYCHDRVITLVRHDGTVIDPDSPVAPYKQVAAILRGRIERGEITARLPSIVDLVAEFGIARTTAAKSLRQLEADGLAELSPGMGYYVRR